MGDAQLLQLMRKYRVDYSYTFRLLCDIDFPLDRNSTRTFLICVDISLSVHFGLTPLLLSLSFGGLSSVRGVESELPRRPGLRRLDPELHGRGVATAAPEQSGPPHAHATRQPQVYPAHQLCSGTPLCLCLCLCLCCFTFIRVSGGDQWWREVGVGVSTLGVCVHG